MIAELSERALILAPTGRDGQIAATLLGEAGIVCTVCTTISHLVEELSAGAGLSVISEEALFGRDLRELDQWIREQPEWSDFPFVLLTFRGGGLERNPSAGRYLDTLGSVSFVERPFHPTTLVSLAKSAIRGRRRQYEARARLVELHESEARYHTLFDTMDEGFCIIRFLDGPEGPLSDYVHVEANSAYERHAGISNVVGQKVREMVPEEAESWVRTYRNVLVTGEPVRFRQELIATERHLELSAFRVEPASRREVAVLFQDVTARTKAEKDLRDLNATLERRIEDALVEREQAAAQLREAQKLETLGQLTGGLAHDMNNLLAPIIGALELLQLRHGDNERSARALDRGLQSAERAKTLVSRMLGFARRQALVTASVDVNALLTGMRDLIASSLGATITVDIFVEPGLPPILVDANQLELAILNLSINAKDAMAGGGRLTITARRPMVAPPALPKQDAGYVSLAISDTGSGMDADTLARAIEPFFSTKEVGKGTGLGLSMVHGFANQTGGAFYLTSAPGLGTTAEFILPATFSNAKGLETEMNGSLPVESSIFLLVDDEPLVRMGTADMIEELGHEVIEAESGAKALEILQERSDIKAVITDFTMPGMTGAELISRIRESGQDMPILLITGYAARDIELDVPQLTKPFRLQELSEALAAL